MSKIDHMSNKIGKCNKYLMPLGLLQRLLANHHQWTCSPHNNIYMEWVMLWVDISGLQSYVCQTDLFLLHSRNPGHCLVLAYPRTLTTTWSTQGHLRNIRSHWNNFWTEFEFRQMHLPHNIEIPQMQSEQQEIQGQSRILFFFFYQRNETHNIQKRIVKPCWLFGVDSTTHQDVYMNGSDLIHFSSIIVPSHKLNGAKRLFTCNE